MQKMVDGGRSNHSEFLVKSMARLNVIYKPMASIREWRLPISGMGGRGVGGVLET